MKMWHFEFVWLGSIMISLGLLCAGVWLVVKVLQGMGVLG